MGEVTKEEIHKLEMELVRLCEDNEVMKEKVIEQMTSFICKLNRRRMCCDKTMTEMPVQDLLGNSSGVSYVCFECGTYHNEIDGELDEEELDDLKAQDF